MSKASTATIVMRRAILRAVSWSGLGIAGLALTAHSSRAVADDSDREIDALLARLTGGAPIESPLVHLDMPPVFANGYNVPLAVTVDSPMSQANHVRSLYVVAPKNPIVLVAKFHFTPQSGMAAISTRIRLSEPQTIIAIAETSDNALLMARTWVRVDSDGCA